MVLDSAVLGCVAVNWVASHHLWGIRATALEMAWGYDIARIPWGLIGRPLPYRIFFSCSIVGGNYGGVFPLKGAYQIVRKTPACQMPAPARGGPACCFSQSAVISQDESIWLVRYEVRLGNHEIPGDPLAA